MEIRRARDQDASAVAALWTEAYSDDPRGGRMAPYAADEFLESRRRGVVLVVEDAGGLVGVAAVFPAGIHPEQVAVAGEGELARLAVAARARRRGLGRRLVRACVGSASGWAGAIVLWSGPHQVEAHALYESLGFERVPERDNDGPTGPRLVFVKPLSSRQRGEM